MRLVLDVSVEKGEMLAFFTADAACRGTTTANYLFVGALWRGATIAFFDTVSSHFPRVLMMFVVLFGRGGCLWSLRGCPLTREAARVSFLDAFWVDSIAHAIERFWQGAREHFPVDPKASSLNDR